MKNYEKEYHLNRHNHLHKDAEYYLTRSKVARRLFFKGVRRNSKILEYGCGLGQNIFLLNNAVGYDVSKFALDFCRSKGIRVVGSLRDLERYGKFDVVLACEVLEHLENPFQALKEMNQQLKDKGMLILVLPIEKDKKPTTLDVNQHLYSWNAQSITNLLLRAGFYPFEYRILRATGFNKLLPFNKISFRLYLLLIKIAAILSGSKHIKIIAIKR